LHPSDYGDEIASDAIPGRAQREGQNGRRAW
jgi:hypothetical protein